MSKGAKRSCFMNKLAKWAFSVTLLVAANLGFASDENTRMLEVHARECIDFLQAFATEDFNPQKALRTNFENGMLVIRYDDEVIKQTDDLAQKWMNDCQDLFDEDKYGPKLFRDSPLKKVLEDIIRDQNFAKMQSNQTVAEQAAEKKKSFSWRAVFYNGVVERLELVTPYYAKFQYKYDSKYLVWNVLENDNFGGMSSTGVFSYKFVRGLDGMRYYSPFKTYKTDYSSGSRKFLSKPKTWKQQGVTEQESKGNFSFDDDKFSAIPKGSFNKNWALKIGAAVGMNLFVYTDNLLEDNDWDPDSSAYIEGVATIDFLIDATLGVIRCSSQSGKCLGFGSGYSRGIFLGAREEKDDWGRTKMATKGRYIDFIKLYGEMYLMSETSGGVRQSIDIPLNADMKYITSKTGFFYDDWRIRVEAGLEISPIQFIPGIYFEIGTSFMTNGLW